MIYNMTGQSLSDAYGLNGTELESAFDINGTDIFSGGGGGGSNVDYTNYQFWQIFPAKAIVSTQGFDIYDNKVFWVQKSGDDTIPANCYVWNLSDGSQAFDTAYVTIYSGHGNNVCFDYPNVYCFPAYAPSRAYVNSVSSDLKAFTLVKTLTFNDGGTASDGCLDETDKTILWTLSHTTSDSTIYLISKWDLTQLTDNGDGTYTPRLIQTVSTPKSSSSPYIQGCRFHDGLLWYANGYSGGATNAYVRALNPNTGEEIYVIDCNTTEEPEGLTWLEDLSAVGGYALYVGFSRMMLRKYTFGSL